MRVRSTTDMKAAVCYEFGKPLVMEELSIRPPRRDEVKVRVAATAICHSDIHDMHGDFGGKLPFVGGHETAGHVEEVGADVTSVRPGDAVIVSLLESCGKCYYCTTGMPYFCETKVTYDVEGTLKNQKGEGVIQKARVGGFAEYVVVHESQLVKIADDLPMDVACLLACGVITGYGAVVNRAKVQPLSSVVVIGAGGVGLNAVQGAVICGANPIIAVDILDSKLDRSREFGATHGINARQADPVAAVKELTGGKGADYAFVTVGSSAALQQAFAMLGRRGSAVMVGIPPATDPMLSLPAVEFVLNEKTLTGGFMGSTRLNVDVPGLIALYRAGRYKLDELIAGRYPLDRINEAIESSAAGDALRNVIVFG
jgi:S-(hydroxymethyl)glutathione dehydrogenase/alcohol dehydrogenase